MTPSDVKQYRFMDRAIRIAKHKVDEVREKSGLRDKVTGSNPEYPYEERSFNIGNDGFKSTMMVQAVAEVHRLERLKANIEYAAAVITDPMDKIIFQRTMEGQSQSQIAIYLKVDQGTVSRRLAKICEYF